MNWPGRVTFHRGGRGPHVDALAGELLGDAVIGQGGDEDRQIFDLACLSIHDRHRLPGIVDEQLLPGPMRLAHDDVELGTPLTIPLAELGVLVPVAGMLLLVLLPEELQRDPLALQLAVDRREVRRLAGYLLMLGLIAEVALRKQRQADGGELPLAHELGT